MSPPNADSGPPNGGPLVDPDRTACRQRLAQMVGRLLARTWWQRRRDSPALPTAEAGLSATPPSAPTPTDG